MNNLEGLGPTFDHTKAIIEAQLRVTAEPIREAVGNLAASMLDRLPPNIKIEYLPRDRHHDSAADPYPIVIYHPVSNELANELILFNKDDLDNPIDFGSEVAYMAIEMQPPVVIQSYGADLTEWVKYGSKIVEKMEEAAVKFHTGQLYGP